MATTPQVPDIRSLIGRCDQDCIRAFQGATSVCASRSHYEINPDHLLLRLLDETTGDITGYRRSLAMSPSLSRAETERLLDQLEALMSERDRAVGVLERLAPSFSDVRHALNELHQTYNHE